MQRSQTVAMDLREKQLLNNFYTLPFIGMGILSISMNKWLHFNDKMCEIFGYTREEFDRMGWHELVGLPCEEEQTGINAVKEGISAELCEEKSLHRKNGDEMCIRDRFSHMADMLVQKSIDPVTAFVGNILEVEKNPDFIQSHVE